MAYDIRPVSGPQVWRGEELLARDGWLHHLPGPILDDIGSAVRDASARKITQYDFNYETIEIPGLRAALRPVANELADGSGVALIRGMDITRYSVEELKLAFLLIGHHMGLIGPQEGNPRSIGEVRDVRPTDKSHYYHQGGPLPMHMDPVDVAGLLCIREAKRGGASCLVSSITVHNEILRERPDLMEILYRGYYQRRREHRRNGGPKLTAYYCPVFADVAGDVVCNYLPRPILLTEQEGLVEFTQDEKDALAILDRTAAREDLRLEMDFQPGDMQFVNNRHIMHGRADYEDHEDLEQRRLLLRLWLTIPEWAKYPETLPHSDVELQTEPA
jgi:hypothetical protein